MRPRHWAIVLCIAVVVQLCAAVPLFVNLQLEALKGATPQTSGDALDVLFGFFPAADLTKDSFEQQACRDSVVVTLTSNEERRFMKSSRHLTLSMKTSADASEPHTKLGNFELEVTPRELRVHKAYWYTRNEEDQYKGTVARLKDAYPSLKPLRASDIAMRMWELSHPNGERPKSIKHVDMINQATLSVLLNWYQSANPSSRRMTVTWQPPMTMRDFIDEVGKQSTTDQMQFWAHKFFTETPNGKMTRWMSLDRKLASLVIDAKGLERRDRNSGIQGIEAADATLEFAD